MLEIIDLFRDKGMLDELGFGSIRDAFSDHFFPGISTIQTRARYLLFVPWIYQRIEQERIPHSQVDRRARTDQGELVRALKDGGEGENDGVIGMRAGDTLIRPPAAIYWTGFRQFHIWQYPGSMAQYYAAVQRSGPAAAASYSDDDDLVETATVRGWHAGLPTEPQGFLESATFSLTSVEAEYLRERITYSAPDSLLALCINGRQAIRNVDYPWLHPDLSSFPDQLRNQLEHAHRLSVLALGAALLYNLLVAQKALDAGLVIKPGLLDGLRADIEASAADRALLRGWRLTDLWSTLASKGHAISYPTRQFVERMVEILENKPAAYADDKEAHRLIERRELALKGGLARLTHRRALERFTEVVGLSVQTYRWQNVQRIVGDIRAGLARTDAAELSLRA